MRERGGDRSIGEANLRKGLAPSMAGTPRAWLAHIALSSSKIIAPNRGTGVFRNELRKRVRTFHGRFVSCGNGEGDRSIGKANLRKGAALQWLARPVPGWRTLRPLYPKSLRQIGELGFSERTPEACTNLSWEVRLLRERGGDRSIGVANLRKGRQPLLWLAYLMPVPCARKGAMPL